MIHESMSLKYKPCTGREREREFFIDNLLVRIHFSMVMIRWTGLVPREPEFPFPGSLTSTFLNRGEVARDKAGTTGNLRRGYGAAVSYLIKAPLRIQQ